MLTPCSFGPGELICFRPTGHWAWTTSLITLQNKVEQENDEVAPVSEQGSLGFGWVWAQGQQRDKAMQTLIKTNLSVCNPEKTLRAALLLLTLYGETLGWISCTSGPGAIKTKDNMARPAWPEVTLRCSTAMIYSQNTHTHASLSGERRMDE